MIRLFCALCWRLFVLREENARLRDAVDALQSANRHLSRRLLDEVQTHGHCPDCKPTTIKDYHEHR